MTQITSISRLRTPSSSHSTFHHPLRLSLFSLSRLFFLLVFLFCCFYESDSRKIVSTGAHVPFSSHTGQVMPQNFRRRFIRSPFMHPTVTSFELARRKSKPRKNGNVDVSKVGVSKVDPLPPMVRSQSPSATSNQEEKRREVGASSRQTGGHPLSPVIISSGSRLPHHPMVATSGNFPHREFTPRKVSVQHQNDQQPITATDGGLVIERERTTKPPKNISQIQKHSEKENYSDGKHTNKKVLTNFYEVLESIGKSTEELQGILRKETISLDDFLEFIDKGKTKEEVLQFLKLQNSTKYPKKDVKIYQPSSFSRNEYDNEGINMDRQKILSELPFTEIVHEVPIERSKTYRNSFKIPTHIKNQEFLEDSQKKKLDYERYSTMKLNKKPKERSFKKKSYKPKQDKYKPKTQGKNPFLMHSGYSTSQLPPQDSPMVIPFLNTRRKDTNTKDSASIISLTVEEKKRSGIVISSNGKPGPIPVRSKIITEKDTPKEPPIEGLITSTFSNKEKRWKDHFYENHPSNLRLVFPMRSILIFCGVLGILTIVTILILIIYGAVKCNQKTVSENYQMNEQIKEEEGS